MRQDLAARRLQTDIRYIQSLAVGIQKRTGIRFWADDERYSVYIEEEPGNWQPAMDPLTKEDFTVQLNSGDFTGVKIEQVDFDGDRDLVFDKWGNPYGGVSAPPLKAGSVTLSGPKEVHVEKDTGRVYIQ